ncbi:hypothetical protein PLESTB_001025700 [Pleodorina starrii]|uniref:Uncharacterized protein n=1 Tax=Pleodorina starrii TaxID=330485 RepID=A0A9W6BPK1_9CHLO|nr:hypothetical protein PLESTM_001816400 [Pleodorina starrii]GLC55758.1 hypothetical protein PLESTB_001025700 [Pleodorina starrii]GLC68830.1 hypothetical protein PLESTF_000743200 [Pleodorina starrii]
MASSPGQQKTSPFNIFKAATWTNGRKKAKQAKLGEENNMYFHPELKRWVERGKEDEAEREAAGPPPPPVLSAGSLTSTPLSKRSLSQRYVLQPNLSISSSMASMAGSMSQNDLAGLSAGYGAGDSFSGPPSAIGSTSPSPPASSSCLIPPAAFAASGSGNSSPSPAAFFVPSPRQPSTPPSPGSFFLPSTPHTPEDTNPATAATASASSVNGSHDKPPRSRNTSAGGDGAAPCDGDGNPASAAAATPPPAAETAAAAVAPIGSATGGSGAPDHDGNTAALGQRAPCAKVPEVEDGDGATGMLSGAAEISGDGLRGPDGGGRLDSGPSAGQRTLSGTELSLRNSLNVSMVSASGARVHWGCSGQSADSLSALTEDSAAADSLSFPNTAERQVDSPVAFLAMVTHGSDESLQPPLARECYRRLRDGTAANASDGGAAISLHEGMGIAPASRPHVADGQTGEAAAAAANVLFELSAEGAEEGVEAGTVVAEADGGGDAVGNGRPAPADGGQTAESLANGDAAAAVAAADAAPAGGALTAPLDAAAADSTGFGSGTGGAAYSQYYYQQYAYLYQYAVEQGYSEADAVAYAQYYAAVYAQQYEAQAPEGQLGAAEAAAVSVVGVEAVEAAGGSAAPDTDAADAADATAGPEEANGTVVEAAWQVVAGAVEEEAPQAAVRSGAEEVEDGGRREEDPVYVTAAAPPAHIGPAGACMTGSEAAAKAEVGPVLISAAPLPADLAAAATAAAHHHQSAVTAAVAAAAAAVEQQLKEQQQHAGGLLGTDAAAPATEAVADASTSGLPPAGAGLAPQQLLLGLGAAGAKRLTQLSSAVASLGPTVAASAPVAAALSAAASTAAAVACGGGFAGLEAGLSDDDFDRIMHPGDPAKLDGPLPWELPEHLRTGRKFLALCANWQLANPGQPYAPHLLLQQPPQQQQTQQQAAVVEADGAHVAHAAEGSSGSAGGAGPVAAAPEQGQQPVAAAEVAADEQLSSYERACRLSQFGQPAATLLLPAKPSVTTTTAPAAAAPAPAAEEPELPPQQPQPQEMSQEPPQQTQPQEPPQPLPASPESELLTTNGEVFVLAAAPPCKSGSETSQHVEPAVCRRHEAATATAAAAAPLPPAAEPSSSQLAPLAPVASAAAPPDLGLLLPLAVDSPQGEGHINTPSSTRTDDPFAGAEHVPLALQMLQQQPSPVGSPARVPYNGVTLEDVLEEEDEEQQEEYDRGRVGAVEASPVSPSAAAAVQAASTAVASCSLPLLGSADELSFFEGLGEQQQQQQELAQVQTPDAASNAHRPEASEEGLAADDGVGAFEEGAVAVAAAAAATSPGAALEDGGDGTGAAPAAAAAAAAIDSVVAALEQLRNSAAAGVDGDVAVADPVTGTALLLQIQASLAQATEALAGMGVDVSALASLAGIPKLHTPATPTEWTPGAGHKRPRVEASPATPTRVVGADAAADPASGVATPLLPPGPPVTRLAPDGPPTDADSVAAAGAVGPGERFQQLGKRLSDASAVAAAAVAEVAAGAGSDFQCPQQPEAVVMSLTLTPAPEVDVAAVEERVRCEERAAAETRLSAVVDSEREAAALVIAGVERERDGLAQRCEELEAALAAAVSEREGLVARLGEAEADCRQARAAGEVAEAERGVLAARLSEVTAERDALAAALSSERAEKAALAEALSVARCDNEELRRRYAERFSALSSELEATRGSLAELQGEHDELLLCLGQESTKVEVLTGALREAGGDPEPLIQRIEAEYETMGLGQGEGEGEEEAAEEEGQEGQAEAVEVAGEGGAESPSDQQAAEEGWEGEDLVL